LQLADFVIQRKANAESILKFDFLLFVARFGPFKECVKNACKCLFVVAKDAKANEGKTYRDAKYSIRPASWFHAFNYPDEKEIKDLKEGQFCIRFKSVGVLVQKETKTGSKLVTSLIRGYDLPSRITVQASARDELKILAATMAASLQAQSITRNSFEKWMEMLNRIKCDCEKGMPPSVIQQYEFDETNAIRSDYEKANPRMKDNQKQLSYAMQF
jgi:hypothetical protein